MTDHTSHNGKEPTEAEMAMIGDVFRYYGVGTTSPHISLDEVISGLVLEGDVASRAVDLVGALIATSEIVAIMLAEKEPLENLSTYVDKSVGFGNALCSAYDEEPGTFEKMARDICAHVMMSGGCTRCFRMELREFLYDALDVSGKILKMMEGVLAMLYMLTALGGEESMIGWSDVLLGRYERLSLSFADNPPVYKLMKEGAKIGKDYAKTAQSDGTSEINSKLGEATGRIASVMLLVNSGAIPQDSFMVLMHGDMDTDDDKKISDTLFANMSKESMDFLNEVGDKLDD